MKIEKTECNYQVTECDLKFGKQITLDGKLLVPISVLDKIRAEIRSMDYLTIEDGSDGYDHYINRVDVLQIIDKYKADMRGEE